MLYTPSPECEEAPVAFGISRAGNFEARRAAPWEHLNEASIFVHKCHLAADWRFFQLGNEASGLLLRTGAHLLPL